MEQVDRLQAEEFEWSELVASLPQIVWITGPDGYHVYFNQHVRGQAATLTRGTGYPRPTRRLRTAAARPESLPAPPRC